jgi:hypothetical protein
MRATGVKSTANRSTDGSDASHAAWLADLGVGHFASHQHGRLIAVPTGKKKLRRGGVAPVTIKSSCCERRVPKG